MPDYTYSIFKYITLTYTILTQYALNAYTMVLHLHNFVFANLLRNIHLVIFAFAFTYQ